MMPEDIPVVVFLLTLPVIFIGYPIARAMARRIESRGKTSPPAITPQLERMERAIEAMSIEIERITEGQRFLTKVLSATPPSALPAARAGVPMRAETTPPGEQRS